MWFTYKVLFEERVVVLTIYKKVYPVGDYCAGAV
jgi:hypothetical protein